MDNNNAELVAVWADNSWCFMDELSEALTWKSDDFYTTWYDAEAHT